MGKMVGRSIDLVPSRKSVDKLVARKTFSDPVIINGFR